VAAERKGRKAKGRSEEGFMMASLDGRHELWRGGENSKTAAAVGFEMGSLRACELATVQDAFSRQASDDVDVGKHDLGFSFLFFFESFYRITFSYDTRFTNDFFC
jgi:hypothetical protein